MIVDEDVYLEHYGKKGMRWGVRNQSNKSEDRDRRNKNLKIALGSVAAVTAIGVGVFYTKKHFNVKVSDISKSTKITENFAKALADEPVGMAHSSRGLNRGYAFLQGGGLKSPNEEFIKAGLDKADNVKFFKKYGANGEKIAARFTDPEGRKDFAGRLIGHDVILPKSMSKDVNNLDDVVKKTWPKIKPLFDAFYESEMGTFGPAY